MLGNLPQDIIGTSPKYPKIVNQDWLNVDVKAYDNYPSDNNPVRVVPKLSQLWDHENTGINLIPNSKVLPLGVRSADEKKKETDECVQNVVKEAKKAMMAGMKGKELAGHLRSLFVARHIEASKEELGKLSAEQGLLGNVYIDASAFSTEREAEQFLTQHRTRLAQDIAVNGSVLHPSVIASLANKFRKNVIAAASYGENVLSKYKNHLVLAGKIGPDYVVDSKEALRQAFLYEKPVEVEEPKKKGNPALSEEEESQALKDMAMKKAESERISHDELNIGRIRPVLEFAQEHLARGKDNTDIKEMLRSSFVKEDLVVAARGLAVIASQKGLARENVESYVQEGKITSVIGDELKRIGKKFPVKAKTIDDSEKSERMPVKGFFYALGGNKSAHDSEYERIKQNSVKALRLGSDPDKVLGVLLTKLSSEVAHEMVAEAINELNNSPAGVKANVFVKAKKELFPEDEKAKNFGLFASELPDPSKIKTANDELVNMFAGSGAMDVEISAAEKLTPVEVNNTFHRAGIDSVL